MATKLANAKENIPKTTQVLELEDSGLSWADIAAAFLTSIGPDLVVLIEPVSNGIDILTSEDVSAKETFKASFSIAADVTSFLRPVGVTVVAVAKGAKVAGKITKVINKVKEAAKELKETVKGVFVKAAGKVKNTMRKSSTSKLGPPPKGPANRPQTGRVPTASELNAAPRELERPQVHDEEPPGFVTEAQVKVEKETEAVKLPSSRPK
ncbi:hypothetical protein CDD83_7664 [Cordyceps sp. RAO-2017]|nr:hypothetical protein CDD83_7664 [Cordyceps sp. RAO-2017]